MYRELQEEIGIKPEHVRILGRTREWRSSYKGQKQIWYLLRMVGHGTDVSLRASNHPEFDAWRWSRYWIPLDNLIEFKRGVYQAALTELSRLLFASPEERHMAETAAHLVDHVFPPLPVRQWLLAVLTKSRRL